MADNIFSSARVCWKFLNPDLLGTKASIFIAGCKILGIVIEASETIGLGGGRKIIRVHKFAFLVE
jgi:hypothetical protein